MARIFIGPKLRAALEKPMECIPSFEKKSRKVQEKRCNINTTYCDILSILRIYLTDVGSSRNGTCKSNIEKNFEDYMDL